MRASSAALVGLKIIWKGRILVIYTQNEAGLLVCVVFKIADFNKNDIRLERVRSQTLIRDRLQHITAAEPGTGIPYGMGNRFPGGNELVKVERAWVTPRKTYFSFV